MAYQLTCAERVKSAWDSRSDDLRVMLGGYAGDAKLIDDGTLDTVIEYCGRELRYDAEFAAAYRDDQTGAFDGAEFFEDNRDDFEEVAREAFAEYGLEFSYVPAGTFEGQESGYFRYLISTGGPGEEIRFYTSPEFDLIKAEFWFLDWFDGAHIDVTNDPIARALFNEFREVGAFPTAMGWTPFAAPLEVTKNPK